MPETKSLKERFKEKLNKLEAGIKDLASLDVTTLSGDISVIPSSENRPFDLDAVVEQLSNQDSTVEGKIYVVATTHMKADQDTIQFVKAELTADEKTLVEAHHEAVKTAQEARSSFLNFIKEFIKPG